MITMTLKQAESLAGVLSTKAGKSYKWLDKKIETAKATPVVTKKVVKKAAKKATKKLVTKKAK